MVRSNFNFFSLTLLCHPDNRHLG